MASRMPYSFFFSVLSEHLLEEKSFPECYLIIGKPLGLLLSFYEILLQRLGRD